MAVNDPYYLHQLHEDYYSYNNNNNNDQRGINTLFVSGLPDDVKPREIHNLFRRRRGFDSSQVKFTGRGNQVVAFVTFFNHESAVEALHALNGAKFDPETGSVLHVELARSNSRRQRKPGSGPYIIIDKRKKSENDAPESSSDGDGDDHDNAEGDGNSATSGDGNFKRAKSEETGEGPDCSITKEPKGRTSGNNAPPCSTLFIANLGPSCTEQELKESFSQCPGFKTLKLRARGGMPVAFADFEDIEQATNAMALLQDSSLPSSDRGGMHIEYARSKMRKA